jgi:BlaI family transcriptional regulator, penicillinase repressor
MSKSSLRELSRRERQIMDIIYRFKEASVADILHNLSDQPPYNSIRVILTILEKKGHVQHRKDGQRYIYYPKHSPEEAKQSALAHIMKTFFNGSTSNIFSTLLDISSNKITEAELKELSEMVDKARKRK